MKYKTHNLDTTTPFWKKYLPKKEIQKEEEKNIGDL